MPRNCCFLGVLSLILALSAGLLLPAAAKVPSSSHDLSAQSVRPRITIHPRHLGPNAKRYCRSWLTTENRVSGTVVTPQMRCWWN
jgi:hypothetical protein